MDRSIKKPDRSSNPTGAPAEIPEKDYLGQVSSIRWDDSEYLSMRVVMALCPECALNVSTPVHSSYMHARSVCVCGWFNVIHRRKHCLHTAGVAGSNPAAPTIFFLCLQDFLQLVTPVPSVTQRALCPECDRNFSHLCTASCKSTWWLCMYRPTFLANLAVISLTKQKYSRITSNK